MLSSIGGEKNWLMGSSEASMLGGGGRRGNSTSWRRRRTASFASMCLDECASQLSRKESRVISSVLPTHHTASRLRISPVLLAILERRSGRSTRVARQARHGLNPLIGRPSYNRRTTPPLPRFTLVRLGLPNTLDPHLGCCLVFVGITCCGGSPFKGTLAWASALVE